METTKQKTYHFVGIKGTGMSALAILLHQKGYHVQGSDIDTYLFTQRDLELEGITLLPFKEENIEGDLIVIAGNAFPDSHIEIKAALKKGLPVIRYHKFLGDFIQNFTSIAVTGSHGKTTTTGLLSHVLSGIEPTSYLIGDGTGHGEADARFLSFEACEYRRHFLAYAPDYAIITNIDFDHPDYYHSIEDVYDAFHSFSKQVKKGVIAYGDDPYLRQITSEAPIYYYGLNESDDFQAINIERTTNGSHFDVKHEGELLGSFSVPTYGLHNVLNALSVIAICHLEGFDLTQVAEEMVTFSGVKRRFSEKKVSDMVIVDDYAHHPAEIKVTIDAARQKYPTKEIIAIFQPHTFTRTIALLDEFASSLDEADHVYLCDIFGSARENVGSVKIEDLGDKITKGGEVITVENMSPLLDYHDAVAIFMGAGDVQKFETAYERLLSNTRPNTM